MALDFLRQGDCAFHGPALPEPYVRFELEKALAKHRLLPDTDGLAGQGLRDQWDVFRRKLRDVSPNSGPVAITSRILEPLVSRLGYQRLSQAEAVFTREGEESGGVLMVDAAGAKLRCWAIEYDADLDAPTQRGYAYRFSPVRIAQRVLLAAGERVGLLTNGVELRLLLCDPARPDSHIAIKLNTWRLSRDLPDGYQLLLALASPKGIAALPEIIEDARLKQNKVTKELRVQARKAVEEFVQAVLEHPDNAAALAGHTDKAALAKQLWHEGLIVVYRLLFVLKCESTSDPSRVFRFASSSLWRQTYSPSTALAKVVRRVLDEGVPSGRHLEDGLRVLFKLFAEGLDHPGLTVRPLGGALFGGESTPLLSSLRWGELAVAHLLNRLLWSDTKRGRERVHYGPLDVEDLGRVYEALLELEPGIATEPMCRLKRQKLEVVVPAGQGEKYRASAPASPAPTEDDDAADGNDDEDAADTGENGSESTGARGKKTKVEWIEAIAPGRFYLRVGLGRKSSGSYYTPHSFVRFLVQETLGPQCDERSPRDNPNPGAILKLKVLDPACGSGHFLVEACRFLAARVYEAARLCDELATKAEHDAEAEKNAARRQALLDRAAELRQRLKDLPDEEDELLSYLPSRSAGAEKAVLSAHDIARAEAICRRLVAVHCLYGVDLNPLAVELAKLSLWIESHAEGFPLTFLDHRIVVGNSLTGPFWDKLKLAPGSQQPVNDLFRQNIDVKLAARLGEALALVRELEASVGVNVGDIAAKEGLKRELDERLLPFRILAAAWSGGVMLGTDQPDHAPRCDDDAYADLLKHVGSTGELPASINNANLQAMISKGQLALSYDLAFPEVFHPTGQPHGRHGFHAVVGNPPWEVPEVNFVETLAILDVEVARGGSGELQRAVDRLAESNDGARALLEAEWAKTQLQSVIERTVTEGETVTELAACFAERARVLVKGVVGLVLPSSVRRNKEIAWLRARIWGGSELRVIAGFVNSRRLFNDLPVVLQFDLWVLGANSSPSSAVFRAIFRQVDDQILFHPEVMLFYPWSLAREANPLKTLLEVDSQPMLELLATVYAPTRTRTSSVMSRLGIDMSQEVNQSGFGKAFLRISDYLPPGSSDVREPGQTAICLAAGVVPLLESKSFVCFNPMWQGTEGSAWDPVPSLCLPITSASPQVHAKISAIASRLRYFRLLARETCGSPYTNERSSVFAMGLPGWSAVNSAMCETSPSLRPTAQSLFFAAVCNAFAFDAIVRVQVGAHLSKFILASIPFPDSSPAQTLFLVHGALRLSAIHSDFEPLWREQLGDAWCEPGKAAFTWSALAGDDERWAVRAAIDAVVADAYGLSREQYAHVLSTFSHASYKQAPQLCLAAFDELRASGLEAFCKKHDPYWDIPLVETLPKPVIDLPIPEGSGNCEAGTGRKTRGRKKKADDAGPTLWQQRDGQLTLEPPGPLFDAPPRPAAPEAGQFAAVRGLLELRKVLTSAEVQAQCRLDASQARIILKQLAEQGLAKIEGKAKGTRYRWSGR